MGGLSEGGVAILISWGCGVICGLVVFPVHVSVKCKEVKELFTMTRL